MERVKKMNIASFLLHFNDILEVAQDIQDDIVTNGKIEEDIMKVYESLELKEINQVASLIDIGNESIFYIDRLTV